MFISWRSLSSLSPPKNFLYVKQLWGETVPSDGWLTYSGKDLIPLSSVNFHVNSVGVN